MVGARGREVVANKRQTWNNLTTVRKCNVSDSTSDDEVEGLFIVRSF